MQNESSNKLDKSLSIMNNELKVNNKKIELLMEENKILENKIHSNLKRFSNYVSIYLKLAFLFFIMTSIGIIGVLSNFNFFIMLLFSVALPVTCIFLSVYINSLLIALYRKKNNKLIALDNLIKKNNDKITEFRKISVQLLSEIMVNSKKYSHPKSIMSTTQNAIITMRKNNDNYINKKGVKKLNKVKTRK